MNRFMLKLDLAALAALAGGQVLDRGHGPFDRVAELAQADAGTLGFLQNTALLDEAKNSQVGVMLVPTGFDAEQLPKPSLIFCPQPQMAFIAIVNHWLQSQPQPQSAIHPTAVVAPDAVLGNGVDIGPYAVVESGCQLGDNCRIMAHTVIGCDCRLGHNCILYPHVVLYAGVKLADNVIVHAGTVLGADGFGYAFAGGKQVKVPQLGGVEIGAEAEIGALSAVDRGALGNTVIGTGAKLDNLVQVGHNSRVGNHTILCSQVGLAGSTTLGNYVYMAGQAGAAGHLEVGDGTLVGAQSGVAASCKPGSRLFGSPALEATQAKRMLAFDKELYALRREILKMIKDYRNGEETRSE